jgi:Flp pilus assembly protein TadG
MIRALLKALANLSSEDRASVMPIMAGVLLVGTAGAAIAVDVGRAYALRSNLQIAADSAALSAAVNLPDMEAAREAAVRYASINMPGVADLITAEDIEFGHWNPETRTIEPDVEAPSALRVTASLSSEKGNAPATLFAGVFGSDSLDLTASAAAGKRSSTCIMALEQHAVDALALDFAASIEAHDCTVQVNSRHERAFRILLGSSVHAAGLCVTGGSFVSKWAKVEPEVTEGCLPAVDPLANLEPPEVGGCDFHNSSFFNYHGTLQPGVYCGGLRIFGLSNVTLAAGVYVIKDGPLSLAGFSEITGEEVAFFLTGDDALIRFSEMSTLTLRAPTDGDLEGILVFQDRDYVGHHIWESDAPTELYGTIYLPNGHLLSQSSNAITPVDSCNVLIAKSIRFAFKSGVSIDLGRDDCKDYLPSAILGSVALLA